YDLPLTLLSLLIALVAAWLAMNTLSHAHLPLWRYGVASVWIGLGIAAMHYVGMAAMRSSASLYYDPLLMALSVLVAIACSLAALLLSRHLREGSGMFHQLLKYASSLVLGAAIVLMHFTGIWAMTLVLPAGSLPAPATPDGHLQLGLTLSAIVLLIIGSG
ncbi:diguanylate phosphodiesterase, partial [Pseudomonas sp. MWU13-2625]